MKHILIVEHEPHLQTLLEYTITPFEDVDVDWTVVASADEALRALDEAEPQLALIDTDLPDQDAIKLCAHFANNENTKIILLVPMGQSPNPSGCEVETVISKPFEPNQLRLLLGRLLGIHVQL